ncbi:hypothetical protein STEG23_034256 [Scotinomys teguina]
MEEIYAKFVSQKISKTRWRPVPSGSLQTAETFATGSWDNEENCVSLWSIGDFGNLDSDGGFEGDHQLLCDIRHHGDVMDLQCGRSISTHPTRIICLLVLKMDPSGIGMPPQMDLKSLLSFTKEEEAVLSYLIA